MPEAAFRLTKQRTVARVCLATALVLALSTGAAEADTIERLAGLSRLWGHVKFLHPGLATSTETDWDAALVEAASAVAKAQDGAGYSRALETMLGKLGDPGTRIESAANEVAPRLHRSAAAETTADGILILHVGDYYELSGGSAQAALSAAREALPAARALVLDLRPPGPTDSFAEFQLLAHVGPIEREIIDKEVPIPGLRRRVYYGYPSTSAFASGQYRSALLTRGGGGLTPAENGRSVPTVVILDRNSAPLAATTALQADARARIVFEGRRNELPVGEATWIELPDGLRARVRISESLFSDGRDGDLRPDAFVEPFDTNGSDTADPALERALVFARNFEPSTVERPQLPATVSRIPERSYPHLTAPGLGHRFLALARFWNVIEHFYPYKHLLDTPWDQVQRELIPKFLAADTALDYALAVAEMATRIQDSHAYVTGRVFQEQVAPNGYPPIRVRWIEDTPVVTALRDPAAAADVDIGDVVVEVDGEDAIERISRQARTISASTPGSLLDKACLQFMNGPVGSEVRLLLRGADDSLTTATLERRAEDYTTLYHRERAGEVVRVLEGNIGYVDLDRLELAAVGDMFDRLAETAGIIFDMRGYPKGTAWLIAPRLADAERTVALLSTPMPGHESPHPASESFRQVVAPSGSGEPRYSRPTVMLVDERTQSQAEHTGLYLRAANGTRFVGSQTAGANGEVTSVVLPGGITVGFTGQSVRHSDGGELQRVGLTPDVEVRPTLAGIRAGRDEVLELAAEMLREN